MFLGMQDFDFSQI